ncbi:MAG TPA: flagellar biosynthetic protein FliO [Opitutus sp.]|nr:flagellar biosynthetic protein FliO [Opitutus sp.]
MTLAASLRLRRIAMACLALAFAGALRAENFPPSSPGAVIYPRGTAAAAAAERAGKSDGPGAATAAAGLALLAVGGWFWWRYRRNPGLLKHRQAQRLAIEETRALGNRQFLMVVAHDDRRFLLGVCPGRIENLAELTSAPAGKPLS